MEIKELLKCYEPTKDVKTITANPQVRSAREVQIQKVRSSLGLVKRRVLG